MLVGVCLNYIEISGNFTPYIFFDVNNFILIKVQGKFWLYYPSLGSAIKDNSNIFFSSKVPNSAKHLEI